jgi:phosphoglucosamine mutase
MAAPRLFGTDGIRGTPGVYPLDRPTVSALGAALSALLRQQGHASPLVLLGGDTRASTPELCAWLAWGLVRGGARVRHAGVIPTPGVARLAARLGAACGVAVSASHNPHPDNGIKLLDGRGCKWAPERELALEGRLAEMECGDGAAATDALGEPESALAEAYLEELAATLPAGRPLAGLSVVLDAAHGAAAPFAGRLFAALGARVRLLHAAPDGRNINEEGGSTHPEAMAAAAREGFDLGVAFDGDADRAILADERGEVWDGDAILYLWARDLREAGRLVPPTIVATSMSNLGLERALERCGIGVERCGVGDREVVATLLRLGLRLGGEQSGHIVDLERSATGDGLLTALQVAHLVARQGRPLSELLSGFRRFPQVLRNVRVPRREDFAALPAVAAAVRRTEERLGGEGRLVLRYSGTEALARIMIEGPDQQTIDGMAGEIAAAIEASLR